MMPSSSLNEIAKRACVDVEDVREVLIWWVGDGAEIDPNALPRPYADALLDVLGAAGVRAQAYPPSSLVGDLALTYRETGDKALLDELRERGYGNIVAELVFERPEPDDLPSSVLTKAETSKHIDQWIASMPSEQMGVSRGGGWHRGGLTGM